MNQQLGNTVPGCIIASCGGGGLLTGNNTALYTATGGVILPH